MGAPKGNRSWEARSSHGRNPKFRSKEKLWNACVEYFEWVEDNPLMEMRGTQFQGEYVMQEFPKMRAMSIRGLCIFLGISPQTWSSYRERKGLKEVTSQVDDIIRNQKFEGAAADLLNPSIIARDLGLVEKQEHTGSFTVTVPSEDAGTI